MEEEEHEHQQLQELDKSVHGDRDQPQSSASLLFPLSSSAQQQHSVQSHSQWLYNSSFTADLSLVNDAVSFRPQPDDDDDGDEEEEGEKTKEPCLPEYRPVESSSPPQSDSGDDGRRRRRRKEKKRRKESRRRERSSERGLGLDDYSSRRRSNVRAWAGDSATKLKPSKDYFFDSKGDRDNLAFGSLYRYWIFVHLRVSVWLPRKFQEMDLDWVFVCVGLWIFFASSWIELHLACH